MTNAPHCLSKLRLIKYFDVMAHVSELGIESIYKVYWMSGRAPPMNVSLITTSLRLSLVTDIISLLLIGRRRQRATCPARYELLFEELSARDMV